MKCEYKQRDQFVNLLLKDTNGKVNHPTIRGTTSSTTCPANNKKRYLSSALVVSWQEALPGQFSSGTWWWWVAFPGQYNARTGCTSKKEVASNDVVVPGPVDVFEQEDGPQ